MFVGARGRVSTRACVMSCAAARGLHSNAYTWLAGWNSPHPCDAAGGASQTPPSPPSHPERVQQRPLSSASHATLLSHRRLCLCLMDGSKGRRGVLGAALTRQSRSRAICSAAWQGLGRRYQDDISPTHSIYFSPSCRAVPSNEGHTWYSF